MAVKFATTGNVAFKDADIIEEKTLTVDDHSSENNATIKPYFADIVAGEPSQVVKDTQLIEAAIYGETARLGELLKRHADPKTANNSPLRLAAENGHAECVKILINAGANAADREALLHAAKGGYADVVTLLARHADSATRSEAIKVANQRQEQTPGAFGAGRSTPKNGHAQVLKLLKG
jgi:hypothetical protein